MLVEELRALGCADAAMTEWGYVCRHGAVEPARPATRRPARCPRIGLLAHVDTYFATPGGGVKPQVIESYDGGDIVLPGAPEQVIRADDNPNLARCVGHTLITTDGTTLLGADDKAGIAEIMTAVAWLRRPPRGRSTARSASPSPPTRRSGRGTEHFDVAAFGADYAYTLDGSDLGEIEDETFCADTAMVTIDGPRRPPGLRQGQDGQRACGSRPRSSSALPEGFLPETTEGREPYLHPYDLSGDVSQGRGQAAGARLLGRGARRARGGLAARGGRRGPGALPRRHDRASRSRSPTATWPTRSPRTRRWSTTPWRRCGVPASSRSGGPSAAAPTAPGSPSWACSPPTSGPAARAFHSVLEWVSLEWMAGAVEATLQLLGVWLERSTPGKQ